MESSNYSLGDIAALLGNHSGFGNGDGLGWLILIFLFFGAMGGGWNRNPGPAVPPNVATVTDVQSMINNQTVNTGLNNIALATADNNYQTAQLSESDTPGRLRWCLSAASESNESACYADQSAGLSDGSVLDRNR